MSIEENKWLHILSAENMYMLPLAVGGGILWRRRYRPHSPFRVCSFVGSRHWRRRRRSRMCRIQLCCQCLGTVCPETNYILLAPPIGQQWFDFLRFMEFGKHKNCRFHQPQ